ncbi:hypothetical protein [Rhodococcus kronopolitis]|uniref:Ferric siderophore reductase C-terminal domain-containing protein n=1 Tax=Rhodococcus kronopolitis TaxID=1460226 RepID=A0ABV9FL43_9NOCA
MTGADPAEDYRRVSVALPAVRMLVEPSPNARVVSGATIVDPSWLAARVAQTARVWRCEDSRVSATLWWYSASSALLAVPTAMLLSIGTAPDPSPERMTFTLRPDGSFATTRSTTVLPGPAEFAVALRATFEAMIGPLAEIGGVGERSLWAIAADGLGNRALDAGSALAGPAAGSAMAVRLAELVGEPMLTPRFVDVRAGVQLPADPTADPAAGARRFVRRSSCCLLYLTGAAADPGDSDAADRAKCISCPNQLPAVRLARLGALVG